MNFNGNVMLTDQLERELIREEIARQMSFAPSLNFRPLLDKIAAVLGYTRLEGTLATPRHSH